MTKTTERKYPESFLRLTNDLERYPIQYQNEMQKKIAEAGISTIESKPLEIKVEAPDAKRLQPWRPPKPLKQRIMEDTSPQAELYKKLIKAWPDISDVKLREIVTETPSERIEKVISIYEMCGKLFTEFLEPNLTYEEIMILDRVYRYYHLLAQAKELLGDLRDGLKYKVEIDGRKHEAELFLYIDNHKVQVNFYPDSYDRPQLGIAYSEWPCLPKFREGLQRKAEAIAEKLKTLEISKDEFLNLQTMLEYLREFEQSFYPLYIEFFITFPIKYTKKDGLLGSHICLNKIQMPCSLCNKQHSLWLIARVR